MNYSLAKSIHEDTLKLFWYTDSRLLNNSLFSSPAWLTIFRAREIYCSRSVIHPCNDTSSLVLFPPCLSVSLYPIKTCSLPASKLSAHFLFHVRTHNNNGLHSCPGPIVYEPATIVIIIISPFLSRLVSIPRVQQQRRQCTR